MENRSTPAVTVIMPVYNSEKTLERAVGSVLAQTFGHWQLIIVDDCSTDNSLSLARGFADPRITVVRAESNGGPAKTRNLGIDKAAGTYLAFIDSDDTYHPRFLEIMTQTALRYDADMVWCNYQLVDDDAPAVSPRPVRIGFPGENPRSRREAVEAVFGHNDIFGSMWCKIYSRDFINRHGLRINDERVRAEDWEFNLGVFEHIEHWAFVDDVLYDYHMHPSSVMGSYRRSDLRNFSRSLSLLSRLAERNGIVPSAEYMTRHHLAHILEYCVAIAGNEGFGSPRLICELISDGGIRLLLRHAAPDSLPPAYRPLAILLRHGLCAPAAFYAWLLWRKSH